MGSQPMIDAGMSLRLQPPQSPQEAAIQQAQLNAAAQERQVRAQQLQNGALDLQQKKLELEDSQKYRQAWMQAGGDLDKTQEYATKMGVGPKTMLAFQQQIVAQKEALAKLGSSELDMHMKQNELFSDLLRPVLEARGDPQKQAQLYAAAQLQAVQKNALKPSELQPYAGPEAIDTLAAGLKTHEQMIKEVTANAAKTTAEARAKEAEINAKKLDIEAPGMKADADQKQRADVGAQLAAAALNGPEAVQAVLDQLPHGIAKVFASGKTPEDFQRIALTPVQGVQAIHEDQSLKETNRKNVVEEAQRAARDKALQEEANARIVIERSRNAREQQIYNQTYGEGANPALVGVEPKLRTQAMTAAQKAADEHTKAAAAEADMQSMIDLAKGGNVLAHSYLPTEGVMTLNSSAGIKRVNMAEIKSYAGTGDLVTQIEGGLKGLATGAKVPPQVLDAMEKLHKQIAANADTTYNSKLDSINQNYRSNFKPAPPRPGMGSSIPADVSNALKNLPPGKHTGNDGTVWLKSPDGSIKKQ